MVRPVNPVVYMPIEYRSREFDGKMALALRLVRAGFTVMAGQQWALYANLQTLPRGVVLFKSQNKIHHGWMAMARTAGHIVVSLEEESMALTSAESIVRNCHPDAYQLSDVILTTGALEKEVHLGAGCEPARLVVTGNPRVDVLKTKFRPLFQGAIDTLTSRFGRFVLINTNFGIRNSKWGSVEAIRQIEINAGSLNPKDPESVRKFEHVVAWEDQNSKSIFETVSRLSRSYSDRTFIVRPHPSESLEKVAQQFAGLANVNVIHEGAHVPWTMASEILIHTSCTTGLEAAIASKRAYSLVTMPSWVSEAFLSNKVNPVFDTVDAVVAKSEAVLSGQDDGAGPDLSAFEHYIRNIGQTLSLDLIAGLFKSFPFMSGPLNFGSLAIPPRNKVLIEKCSISLDEMKASIKTLSPIFDIPAGSEAPVYELGESLFLILPAHAAVKAN
jgi:surface carbohydrate biosynthesis protein